MNMKYIIAGSILAIAASSSAYAQEKQNEISAFLYASQPTEPSGQDPLVTVYGSYGRYFGEQFALVVSLSITDSGGFQMVGPGVGVKYYFKAGQKGDFVPFVSGEFQTLVGSGPGVDMYAYSIAGGVGASYYITETASIDGRFIYQTGETTATSGGFDTTYTSSGTLTTLGITQRF